MFEVFCFLRVGEAGLSKIGESIHQEHDVLSILSYYIHMEVSVWMVHLNSGFIECSHEGLFLYNRTEVTVGVQRVYEGLKVPSIEGSC